MTLLARPVRVVGVGSAQGDDAVGWEVVEQLRKRSTTLPDVELHTAEGGQRLLDLLDGRGSLLVIDAIDGLGQPGKIHRVAWPDSRLAMRRVCSTHGLRPAEAMQLAATLGLLPPQVLMFGVEGENFDRGRGLSAAVAVALPELRRRIEEELGLPDGRPH